MPNIFDQYAPYRPKLSDDQMDDITNSGDPARAARLIAMAVASDQVNNWPYPDDPEITAKYPGVDPRGKYCEADMDFFFRISKVEAALSTRPPEVQQYVKGLFDQLGDKSSTVWKTMRDMKNDAMQVCTLLRAAKVAANREASDQLYEEFSRRQDDLSRTAPFRHVVSALEYAAGLSGQPLSQETRDFMRDTVHAPIPPAVEAVRTAPAAAPAAMSVNFQNFDHIMAQQFFSNPQNWGKGPRQMPPDITNAEAGALAVSKYAAATVDRTIQPLFEKLERTDPLSATTSLDRGGLITVDGKTIRSMMIEGYQGDPKQFNTWYRNNLREMTNQIVSAGLMAGKRVETLVPDAQGRLPKEPTQITKSGYEPSPLKKITLNAWERHFSKYGFYKEKAAKAAEYQRVMAGREQMRTNYTLGQLFATRHTQPAVDDLFFHDYKQQHGVSPEERLIAAVRKDDGFHAGAAFRMDRSAPVSACICYLSAQGHSIEDIMDPNKLQAERQAAGKLYLEKANAGDTRWLCETFFKGMHALVPQAREFISQVDMSDVSQARDNIARYAPIARPLFDVFQEASSAHAKATFNQVAKEAGTLNGIQNGEDLLTLAQNAGLIMTTAEAALAAPMNMAAPNAELKPQIANMLGMSIMQQALHNSSNPDILQRYGMLEQAPIAAMGSSTSTHPVVQGIYDQIKSNPAARQAVAQMGLTSQFQKQFSAKSVSKGSFSQIEILPSKSLQASMEKQQKAQQFQKDHPKPEPKKDAPQKAAPQKPAPAKNPGGMKK